MKFGGLNINYFTIGEISNANQNVVCNLDISKLIIRMKT